MNSKYIGLTGKIGARLVVRLAVSLCAVGMVAVVAIAEDGEDEEKIAGLSSNPFLRELPNPDLWDTYYVRDLGLFVGERGTVDLLRDKYRTGTPLLTLEKDASELAEGGSVVENNPFLWLREKDATPTRGLISFQLQKDFDVKEDGLAEPASFIWSKDYTAAGGTEDYAIDAALIANIYYVRDPYAFLPGLFTYNPERFAYHHRVGVEYDRYEVDGKLKDELAYRVEAEFLPWRPFDNYGPDDLKKKQGIEDRITVGVEFRQDRVAEDESWAVDVSYRPVAGLSDGPSALYDGLFLGRRNYFLETNEDREREADRSQQPARYSTERRVGLAPVFFQTGPVITLEDAETSALADRGFDDNTVFAKGTWNTSLGVLRDILVFDYNVVAMQPLNGPSDLYVYQVVSMKFTPEPEQPLSVTVAYRRGEKAPSFGNEDLLTVSLGIQF